MHNVRSLKTINLQSYFAPSLLKAGDEIGAYVHGWQVNPNLILGDGEIRLRPQMEVWLKDGLSRFVLSA